MINRIVSGTVATLALLTVVTVDARWADGAVQGEPAAELIRHGSLIPVVMTLIVAVAAIELLALLRRMGLNPCAPWAVLMCAALMLSPWLSAGRCLGGNPSAVEGQQWQLIWIMTAVVGAMTIHLRRGVGESVIRDLASTLFVILYLGLLPSFAVAIRASVSVGDPIAGAWTLFVILAIVFASDIAALYIGTAFGRRKLAPAISPGKTIVGSAGGVAGSVAIALGFWALGRVIGPEGEPRDFQEQCLSIANQITLGIVPLSAFEMAVFGAVLSIASQIGDLVESQIKRCANVKDSSVMIPGMGGVLDVIDGAIFALPLGWLLLTIVWKLL